MMTRRWKLTHISGFGVAICGGLLMLCIYYGWPEGISALQYSPGTENDAPQDNQHAIPTSHAQRSKTDDQQGWLGNLYRTRHKVEAKIPSLGETDWLRKRQELMSNCSRARRLLLFTYMRGGSTLGGQVFNQSPLSMYWYEVADSFYIDRYGLPLWTFPQDIKLYANGSARHIPKDEEEAFATFFDDVTSCRLRDVPVSTLTHPALAVSTSTNRFFRSLRGAVSSVCTSLLTYVCGSTVAESIQNNCPSMIEKSVFCESNPKVNCPNKTISSADYVFRRHENCQHRLRQTVERRMDEIIDTCMGSTIQVSKIHRLSMSSMEAIIQKIPDISIIYYIRDPRGTVVSRQKTLHSVRGNLMWSDSTGNKNLVTEARVLCQQMRRDIKAWTELDAKYPNVFLKIRYEDLVLHPDDVIRQMYAHIGHRVHWEVRDWVQLAFNSYSNDGAFGTKRENSTATATAWEYDVTPKEWESLWTECHDVLTMLGYPKGKKPTPRPIRAYYDSNNTITNHNKSVITSGRAPIFPRTRSSSSNTAKH